MEQTHNLYSTFIANGTYFFDFNVTTRIFMMSDTLRYLVGFKDSLVAEAELDSKIPKQYRSVINAQFRHNNRRWVMPLETVSGLQWMRVERLTDYSDVHGETHSAGIAAIISEEDAYTFQRGSGIKPETVMALLNAIPLLNDNDTFYTGIHRVLKRVIADSPSMSVGVLHWMGGDNVSCIDFVGKPLKKVNGGNFKSGDIIVSSTIRKIIEAKRLEARNNLKGLFANDPLVGRFVEINQIAASISMPLTYGDNTPWGLVAIFRNEETIWGNTDMDWITIISKLIENCISQIRKNEAIHEQLEINNMAASVGTLSSWSWNCSGTDENAFKRITQPDDVYEIFPSDKKLLLNTQRAVADGKTSSIDITIRVRGNMTDNVYKWVRLKGRVIRWNEAKIPQLMVGVTFDIDEEKREELNEMKQRRYRERVYDKLPVGVIGYDVDGKSNYYNKKTLEITGIKTTNKKIAVGLFNLAFLSEEQKKAIRDLGHGDFVHNFNLSKVEILPGQKNHESIEVTVRISKMYFRKRHSGYLMTIIDNTLVALQARKLMLFNSYWENVGEFARLGIFWRGADNNNFASNQWIKNFNASKSKNPFYCQYYDNVVPEDMQKFREQFKLLTEGSIQNIKQAMRVNHEDGTQHWISLHFVRNSNIDGITGISIDVTEQKTNEKLLIKARDKAERMDMLKSQFLANMSHEIRTPLNAIVGFSSLIAEAESPEERMQYSEMVNSNTDLLLKLINDILDLSKIESGTLEFSYSNNRIDDICQTVYKSLELKTPKGVEFIYNQNQQEKDTVVYCDRIRISQVIINFVTNAFKFTTHGRVMLWYEITDKRLIIHVSDTGKGIAPDKIDAIFESFVKLDTFATGTGIGLAISRSIAKQMGGSIEVDSELGKGSHFRLVLPNINDDKLYWRDAIEWQNTVAVMSYNVDLLNFVSFSLDKKNVVRMEAVGFLLMWFEKKPPLTIVDVSACEDTVIDYISSIRSYGDQYKVIALLPHECNVTPAELTASGANEVITLPTDHDTFMKVTSKFFM